MIDRLAVLLDQDDGAGYLAGRHFVLEEVSDLRELVGIEMGAGGNIEGALGAPLRHRQQRKQRAAKCRTQ